MTSRGRGRKLVVGGVVLAAVLVAVGVFLWRSEPAGFGWFSYEPLTSEETVSSLVFVSTRRYAALGLFAAGLVLLGGVSGFALGRRSAPNAAD
ncbi:hypothetical protein N865_07145 [Intrasporangium oryzae NRRL B-24470]|uniref:Uncharacterized protein n=1 Tax=Intrasporangium oryzae NRRL B-24470 TaxID=1386089 RepID=W9G7V9_9MICO|nr:hypothetical protein [Intrasporangium oryzae]EWT02105.1 hypothetical protein N865_07145 [Intrasporangium oryzae NRRL B-24470]